MESKFGEVRKIHIVYFLSRGGHVEHPHMIKVRPAARNGVRLKDVKRWLSNIRGKDMPDSFAWSYKRRYKAGYVWQDLCDNDLITPICDNEYILKGCEILPNNQDNCKCGAKSETQSLLVEEVHNKSQCSEASMPMLKIELPERQTNSEEDSQNYSEPESYKAMQRLKGENNVPHFSDESEDFRSITEYWTKTSGNSPSRSIKNSGEVVKSYIAVRSPSTDLKFDAATQTGESRRLNYDKQESPPLSITNKSFDNSASFEASKKFQKSLSYSKLSCMKSDVGMSKNANTPAKDSRQGKAKAGGASTVLRQLFTCGGLETRDSRIHTVKSLTFNRPSNQENKSEGTVSNAPSSTASTKCESELITPDTLSVTAISVIKLDKSDYLKRDVQNSPIFSPAHSSSSSTTGEFAARKIADIPSTDINSYCQNREADGLHVAANNANNNVHEFSVRASPPKESNPTMLLDDLKTNLPGPKTDSKSSRKLKSSEVSSDGKHNGESNCVRCGRSFKAEYLKAHSKYCRGPKNAIKVRRSIAAK